MDKTILIANEEKFRAHIVKRGECSIYEGWKDRDGHAYFQFSFGGKKYKIRAHRAALIFDGREPGEATRHTCDVPDCVEPLHLIVGTHEENVADRVSRGRSATGDRNKGGRRKVQN